MKTLYTERQNFKMTLPHIVDVQFEGVSPHYGHIPTPSGDEKTIKNVFPHTYGQKVVTFVEETRTQFNPTPMSVVVVLSGGQAPGGHNVIAGVYDAVKKWNKDSKLYGALSGPDGLVKGDLKELDEHIINAYRGTGGFDMIGSGRGKITTKEQFEGVENTCKKYGITTIVIIGGDDSNTNAAFLAEYFMRKDDMNVNVVGCPKTIDGDLKNSSIETSFGFDTATKVYSELIGNLEKDAASARKYWFFIKLMGRSASHVALECALQTHPNICLIGEEVKEKKLTFKKVVDSVASVVKDRATNGKNYGVCLLPEGIIEFIPEIATLIKELNTILAREKFNEITPEAVSAFLTKSSLKCYSSLPYDVQVSLISERDPHGNVQVSKIQSEQLIGEMVKEKLAKSKVKVSPIYNFFGYEGRSAYPSNFDATYCYVLGYNAVLLASINATGYMSTVQCLTKNSSKWKLGGVPIVSMFDLEERKGVPTPVIKKALVDLNGPVFKEFEKHRDVWASEDDYVSPGPIQYFGDSDISNAVSKTLLLESKGEA